MDATTGSQATSGSEADNSDLERLGLGDDRALERLMKRHGPALYGFLVHRLGDRASADDAYAEVWLRAWQGRASYREQGRIQSWLFTIAHRLSLDALERLGKRPISIDQPAGEESPLAERLASPEPGPEASAESGELGRRMSSALGELPPDQREVFLMREYGGLSFKEIAETQECPLGTALARMRYAVQKLRKSLEGLHA